LICHSWNCIWGFQKKEERKGMFLETAVMIYGFHPLQASLGIKHRKMEFSENWETYLG